MRIESAKFIKGIVRSDELLGDGTPQIAVIGASNVGKSSMINSLTNSPGLAIASSSPGRTRQINLFHINKKLYLLDLPGYGYARASKVERAEIQKLIGWYLFQSGYVQKMVILVIDAYVGLSPNDLEMIDMLEEEGKNIVIVANKIDKVKSSQRLNTIKRITDKVEVHKVVAYSSRKKIGVREMEKLVLG